MAEMSMNKVIHGAVRRDLQRFLDATAGFEDGDRARAAALGVAWDNFDDQLTRHHTDEHAIAWPAMAQLGVSAEQLASFDGEHDTMATALAAARLAMAPFRVSGSATDATAFHDSVVELQRIAGEHLDHEEAALEQIFLDNLDSPVIKEMGRKFGKVPPPVAGRFFAWVADGASAEEKAGMEASVPKPVLAIIGGIWGRGYRRAVAPVWRS